MKQVKNLLGLMALAAAAHANAACVDSFNRLLHPTSLAGSTLATAPSSPHLIAGVYHPDALRAAGLVPVADWGNDRDGIVGLWQFQLSGSTVDWGTQAWHSDGTEMIYSMAENPAAGNVCQGVWQQIGPRTYSLNHLAMGWAAPGADPTQGAQFLRVHLHAIVTLSPNGQTFTGKYTASVYLESESDPFNEDPRSNPSIGSGAGTLTGTRVNPDPAR